MRFVNKQHSIRHVTTPPPRSNEPPGLRLAMSFCCPYRAETKASASCGNATWAAGEAGRTSRSGLIVGRLSPDVCISSTIHHRWYSWDRLRINHQRTVERTPMINMHHGPAESQCGVLCMTRRNLTWRASSSNNVHSAACSFQMRQGSIGSGAIHHTHHIAYPFHLKLRQADSPGIIRSETHSKPETPFVS